jgi:hypothetical protein
MKRDDGPGTSAGLYDDEVALDQRGAGEAPLGQIRLEFRAQVVLPMQLRLPANRVGLEAEELPRGTQGVHSPVECGRRSPRTSRVARVKAGVISGICVCPQLFPIICVEAPDALYSVAILMSPDAPGDNRQRGISAAAGCAPDDLRRVFLPIERHAGGAADTVAVDAAPLGPIVPFRRFGSQRFRLQLGHAGGVVKIGGEESLDVRPAVVDEEAGHGAQRQRGQQPQPATPLATHEADQCEQQEYQRGRGEQSGQSKL